MTLVAVVVLAVAIILSDLISMNLLCSVISLMIENCSRCQGCNVHLLKHSWARLGDRLLARLQANSPFSDAESIKRI